MLHNGIQVYSLLAVRMNWDISSRKNIAMSKLENEHPDSNSPNLDLVKHKHKHINKFWTIAFFEANMQQVVKNCQ